MGKISHTINLLKSVDQNVFFGKKNMSYNLDNDQFLPPLKVSTIKTSKQTKITNNKIIKQNMLEQQ